MKVCAWILFSITLRFTSMTSTPHRIVAIYISRQEAWREAPCRLRHHQPQTLILSTRGPVPLPSPLHARLPLSRSQLSRVRPRNAVPDPCLSPLRCRSCNPLRTSYRPQLRWNGNLLSSYSVCIGIIVHTHPIAWLCLWWIRHLTFWFEYQSVMLVQKPEYCKSFVEYYSEILQPDEHP